MDREKISWIIIGGFLLVSTVLMTITYLELEKPQEGAGVKTLPGASAGEGPEGKAAATLAAGGLTRTVPKTLLPPASPDRATPDEDYARIETPVDLMLFAFAWSDWQLQDADVDHFARQLSYEYRAAANAFDKKRILDTFKTQMQQKIKLYKETRYFTIDRPFFLEKYDLGLRAFPLVATQGVSVDWLQDGRLAYFLGSYNYTLTISNAGDFAHYRVKDDAKAQALEAQSPLQRQGQGTVYLFAEDVDPDSQTLRAKILKTQLYAHDKKLLSELEAPTSS